PLIRDGGAASWAVPGFRCAPSGPRAGDAARPETSLRPPPSLIHSGLILEHQAACTSPGADVGAAERHAMDDEGRGTGGLEPAPYRRRPDSRAHRGRGHHFRHRRAPNTGAPGRATYAALDLGTNNCRLLIARPSGDGFRVIDAFSRIIRLGEGLSTTGRLSEAAIARAVGALAVCRDKMVNRGVTRARLIATEACRAAANGAEFLDVIRDQV